MLNKFNEYIIHYRFSNHKKEIVFFLIFIKEYKFWYIFEVVPPVCGCHNNLMHDGI